MQMMQQMQQMLHQMSIPQGTTNSNSNSNWRNSRCQRNPNQRHYCWRHGACNHPSRECRDKGEGHQDEATFQNRMGGSTKNIINPWLIEPENINFNKQTESNNNKSIINFTSSNAHFNNKSPTCIIAEADSGTNNHYFRINDTTVLKNVQPCIQEKAVKLPNNCKINITKQGLLPLSNVLSPKAKTVHILPNLKIHLYSPLVNFAMTIAEASSTKIIF